MTSIQGPMDPFALPARAAEHLLTGLDPDFELEGSGSFGDSLQAAIRSSAPSPARPRVPDRRFDQCPADRASNEEPPRPDETRIDGAGQRRPPAVADRPRPEEPDEHSDDALADDPASDAAEAAARTAPRPSARARRRGAVTAATKDEERRDASDGSVDGTPAEGQAAGVAAAAVVQAATASQIQPGGASMSASGAVVAAGSIAVDAIDAASAGPGGGHRQADSHPSGQANGATPTTAGRMLSAVPATPAGRALLDDTGSPQTGTPATPATPATPSAQSAPASGASASKRSTPGIGTDPGATDGAMRGVSSPDDSSGAGGVRQPSGTVPAAAIGAGGAAAHLARAGGRLPDAATGQGAGAVATGGGAGPRGSASAGQVPDATAATTASNGRAPNGSTPSGSGSDGSMSVAAASPAPNRESRAARSASAAGGSPGSAAAAGFGTEEPAVGPVATGAGSRSSMDPGASRAGAGGTGSEAGNEGSARAASPSAKPLEAAPVVDTGLRDLSATQASWSRSSAAPAPSGVASVAGSSVVSSTSADIDRFMAGMVERIRTVATPAGQGLETRLQHPDLGSIRLVVSGLPGDPVRAELIASDRAAADALTRALDRATASGGLAGIQLRIRTEAAAGSGGMGAGADGHSGHPARDDGRQSAGGHAFDGGRGFDGGQGTGGRDGSMQDRTAAGWGSARDSDHASTSGTQRRAAAQPVGPGDIARPALRRRTTLDLRA